MNENSASDVQAGRTFATGATRDSDAGKLDYEGFLSPSVLRLYAEYMTRHRTLKDGSVRASDNWQKGIPLDAYMKSAFRHFVALWSHHRYVPADETIEDALCGLLFNIQGYAHEHLKAIQPISEAIQAEVDRLREREEKLCAMRAEGGKYTHCGLGWRAKRPFKVGDRVRVLKSFKGIYDGREGVIGSSCGDSAYFVSFPDRLGCWAFSKSTIEHVE